MQQVSELTRDIIICTSIVMSVAKLHGDFHNGRYGAF